MPKHTHIIEAEDAEDFCAQVSELHAMVNGAEAGPSLVNAAALAASEGPKRGRGRPKGSTPKEVAEEAAPEAESPKAATPPPSPKAKEAETPEVETTDNLFGDPPAPVPAKTWTVQELQALLKKVVDKHGLPKAKEIMLQFAPQVPKMHPKQHEEFVAACNSIL